MAFTGDQFSRIEPRAVLVAPNSELSASIETNDGGADRQIMALCGKGSMVQANAQKTINPTWEILTADPNGPAELVDLADAINKEFTKQAGPLLEAKRKSTTIGELELTILIAPEGFRLVYAWPHPKAKKAHPPQWVLGGTLWLGLSRIIYRLTHRRARIPDSAYNTPSPTKASAPKKTAPKKKAKSKSA